MTEKTIIFESPVPKCLGDKFRRTEKKIRHGVFLLFLFEEILIKVVIVTGWQFNSQMATLGSGRLIRVARVSIWPFQ
jgi:NADH:ubiquinone oxidoreductase subunit H